MTTGVTSLRSSLNWRMVLVFSLLFLLSAGKAASDEASPSGSPTVIGLLSDLTGTNGANGDSCREGYELARRSFASGDQIGKTKLSFLFGDHKGEPKTGTSEFLRMVNQGRAIAVVSNRGNVGMALDPISARLKIPLIGIMGHTGFLRNNPVGYRFWPSPKQEGSALAKAALRVGKRVASLDLQDEYILSIVDAFKAELAAAGGEIVFSDSVSEQDTDWASLLTRMRSSKPDVIFLNTTVGKLGALVRRAREVGVSQPIISNFWLSYPSVAEAAGAANIEGSGYVALDTGKAKFLEAHRRLFPNSRANAVTLACFSGLAFLLQNIPDSGGTVTAENLNHRLLQATEVLLPDQAMKISDREAHFDLVFETYRNGTPVKVETF